MSRMDRVKKKYGHIITKAERKQMNKDMAMVRQGRSRDHTDALSLISRVASPSGSEAPLDPILAGAILAGEVPSHKEQNAALPIVPVKIVRGDGTGEALPEVGDVTQERGEREEKK
jgi:hypothetical protein